MHRSQATDDVAAKSKKADAVLTARQIDDIFNRLYPLIQVTEEQKTAHIEEINKTKRDRKVALSATVQTVNDKNENTAEKSTLLFDSATEQVDENAVPKCESERVCPRCGGKMIKRTATKGERRGKNFFGCENFPKCRYIENID